MALGSQPDVSLAQARQQLDEGRRLLAAGVDPMDQRREAKVAQQIAMKYSFQALARKWWDSWSTARSERHAKYVKRQLQIDVFPVIGHRPIAELVAVELVAMVKRVEARGALDITKRAMQTCGPVIRYAITHGKASHNPEGLPAEKAGARL